ncbi:MAG TPA: hypothetical protein VM030_08715 [Acidimicrobiales bacterium]|nr:hypothetical protein [Acidimicrobiales bacterium]
MLLWFLGGGVALVWLVFKDPVIDFRVVGLGVLLPDVLDAGDPVALPFHSLCVIAGVLGLVMVATRRRRDRRRRWLALPIAMFVHLVLDAAWGTAEVFWWPVLGRGVRHALPAADRGLALVLLQELAGLAALVWAWREFRLAEPERRHRLVREGRLGA